MKTSLRKVLTKLGVTKSPRRKTVAATKPPAASKPGPATRTGAMTRTGATTRAGASTRAGSAGKPGASTRAGATTKAGASPHARPALRSGAAAKTATSAAASKGAPPAPRRIESPAMRAANKAAIAARTGETIFGQRALRFHSLTLNAADLEQLEHPGGIQGGFKIRVARQAGSRRSAGSLVDKRYSGRGYTTTPAAVDPQLSTFLAFDEGILVGTVSVRLDSRKGLSADELYHREIDEMRRNGWKPCEFTRLAVDKTVASKPVLAGLFHTAYLYAALIRGYTHAVIEVNPRHVSFYRKALDFERVGDERMNLRVHAPAVLLCVAFDAIAEGLHNFAGRINAPGAGRSLYPYGFEQGEESGVLGRLRELVDKSPA